MSIINGFAIDTLTFCTCIRKFIVFWISGSNASRLQLGVARARRALAKGQCPGASALSEIGRRAAFHAASALCEIGRGQQKLTHASRHVRRLRLRSKCVLGQCPGSSIQQSWIYGRHKTRGPSGVLGFGKCHGCLSDFGSGGGGRCD